MADAFLDDLGGVVDTTFSPVPLLPGDDVTAIVTRVAKGLDLGDGLQQQQDQVLAVRAGVLRYRPPNKYWVEQNQRKYTPASEHFVVGTVSARSADFYRVDIGAPTAALLPTLAFDGASKRNRPQLEVGSLVYARVAAAHRHTEPELSCCAVQGAKKEWMTGDATFGALDGGYCFNCSVAYSRQLLRPCCFVLECIGKCVPFELAIGHNGRVWVDAEQPLHIIFVSNAILNAELLTDDRTSAMVTQLWETIKRRRPGRPVGLDDADWSDDDERH
eukprot:g1616.t1